MTTWDMGTDMSEIQSTGITIYRGSFGTSNGREIVRIARILTIFEPNRSRRRELKFEKFSNKRRRHCGIVVVIVAVVVVNVDVHVVAASDRYSRLSLKKATFTITGTLLHYHPGHHI